MKRLDSLKNDRIYPQISHANVVPCILFTFKVATMWGGPISLSMKVPGLNSPTIGQIMGVGDPNPHLVNTELISTFLVHEQILTTQLNLNQT